MLNGLDLFSGIGGLSVALAPWARPVAYCENDRYDQSDLLCRMANGLLPVAPIWDDVRTLRREHLPSIDMVYGGFPCQDISVAGRGAGLEGNKSSLFLHVVRITEEVKPALVFLENSPAIRTRGLSRVVLELARLGFHARWTVVSAQEVGACHERKRWFLLAAHPDRIDIRVQYWRRFGSPGESAPKHLSARKQGFIARTSTGLTQPRVDRAGDGIPHRMDRLRALGNAVVPLQAREAFKRLAGIGG